jgi:glycosyltransferase involved in cell wall biosynthesis
MKIVVYAIAKNEAAHVDRFCEAAKDADQIIVADTGSTDDTVARLEKHGVTVHHIHISPWRFDDARNAALALVPADTDICVSLDLDELLQPGWREDVEKAWTEGTTRLRYLFDWGHGIVFASEKMHARKGYRWHHPCHERVVPDRITEVWQDIPKLLVVHKPDESKSRGQYLDLLKLSVEEDPHCDRNAFYYARELYFAGQYEQSIQQAQRHLALPKATWAVERAYGMRIMGKSYAMQKDPVAALAWFRRACSEAPGTREPWCDLAEEAYRQARWPECYGAALTALNLTHRELLYTADPDCWGAKPYDLAAVAAWNLGLNDIALIYAKQALGFAPDDDRLKKNVELMSKQA